MAVVPVSDGLNSDEARMVKVLAANQLVAGIGSTEVRGGAPSGWVWAQLGRSEAMSLVPAELHGAFRHRGGVSDRTAPAVATQIDTTGSPVQFRATRRIAADAIEKFEGWLGYRLPEDYRDFLIATNGGLPSEAAVVPGCGLLVDQPLFGLAAADRMQDLAYANLWLRDRFTTDFLAVGYVQGGLLVLQTRGDRAGSVWFWDDDDRRDDERYGTDAICRDLLMLCAPDFGVFLATLSGVPQTLARRASEAARRATLVRPDGMGAALPRSRRPEWLIELQNVAQPDPSAPLR